MTDKQSNIGNKNVNMFAAALALSALSGCGSSPDRQAELEEVTLYSYDNEKAEGRRVAAGVLEASMAAGKLPATSYVRVGSEIVYLNDPELVSKLSAMRPLYQSPYEGDESYGKSAFDDNVKLVVGGPAGNTACVVEFDNGSAQNFLNIAGGQAMAEHPATPADIKTLCGEVNKTGTYGVRVTYHDSFPGAPLNQTPATGNVSGVVIDGKQVVGPSTEATR